MTEKLKMIHKTTTKQDAMAMVNALKKAGAPITKDSMGGYWLKTKKGTKLFTALPGKHNWLVGYVPDLFSQEPQLTA